MKLAQFFGKNQLDEMQERTMREMAGTWAVFMISCVYIVAACLRAGL